MTGWPAETVRTATSAEGLLIAVQLVARPWRDDMALATHCGSSGSWARGRRVRSDAWSWEVSAAVRLHRLEPSIQPGKRPSIALATRCVCQGG